MHSHLTHAIINKKTGDRVMPAESANHGLRLMNIWKYHWQDYRVARLQYDSQPEIKLKGYGITKPGYLLIKYLAQNPCVTMEESVRHIMREIFGKLEYQNIYNYNSKTQKFDVIDQRIYYGHFAYLFTPYNSNMTTYGKRTRGRKWIHRFKGPDGVYRYHLTALGLDAANKIWQRHHYKWAKIA